MSDVSAARLSPDPLRFIFPRNTRKWLSRRFGISVETARDWLRDGIPASRRLERARVILAELDEIEARIKRLRDEEE